MLDYAREKREKKKDAKKIVWIIGALAVVFVVLITRFALVNESDPYTGMPTSDVVYTMAKYFVRPTLKGSNIDFLSSGYKLTMERDSVYVIRSSAKITDNTGWTEDTYFEVVLKYKGGSTSSRKSWEVLNLDKD